MDIHLGAGQGKQIEILEPTAGKRFWQTADATVGIYIILAGKVRLLDSTDNLIASVGAHGSFGELILFPEEQFQPYAARASVNLRLCYIPGDFLRSLKSKYPDRGKHLHHHAVLRDSLLISSNATQSTDNQPVTAFARNSDAAVFPQPAKEQKKQKKISKAYFPNPSVKVGQWWQRVTRRYPFFAQQSASDCGAASLVMVGRYWGKRFSVNRLRDVANVDRNGASLRGLAAAAESIGFTTRPVKASLNKLAEQSLPAIIHWEGKHYVVVYEVTRDRVIVADPAIGQRTLTHAQFLAGWTGYTLILQPTALLKEAKEASTPFGQLVAFNMLLNNVIRPLQRLIVLWNELQEVVIAVERINDVIDTEPEEDLHSSNRQFLPPIRGHIRFEQVTFRYHPESDINTLENVSFEVQPGQMVALVGRSGSGKTTVSKLVLGLYPPTVGKILIDGYDVTSLSLRSLPQQIGVVDQDTFLFGGTIRENISVGNPEATLEEIIEAAQQAGAHQFIKELPMGYETQIGEGGGMLSNALQG